MIRSCNIFLPAIALSLVACETVVDVDVPNEPTRLVANAFLQADSTVVLELTQSQSILTNSDIRPVSGAEAVLLEEGRAVTTLEETQRAGVYTASFTPTVGRSYTLQVSKVGFEPVEATTFIRPPVMIREFSFDTVAFRSVVDYGDSVVTEVNFEVDEVRISFDDPAADRNYYEISAYRFEVYARDSFDNQGNYVQTDTIRTRVPLSLESDDPALAEGEGDFLASDAAVAYGEVLSFNDDFFNGNNYSFQFDPNAYYDPNWAEPQLYVVLRTIDEGQYRYFRSVDLQYENDGNPFAEPVQVYSNVENGFGIVSGSSADEVVVNLE